MTGFQTSQVAGTPHSPKRLGRSAAFSLLELMVVLVLLFLLTSLVLAGYARVRDQVRSVQCLHHVRQWGWAILGYADDHDQFFPYEGHFLTALDQGANQQAWYNVLAPYHGQPALKDLYHQNRPPLPGRRSPWACPEVGQAPSVLPTVSQPYFMYGFNNRLDPNGPARFKTGQVRKPSRTAVFTENAVRRYPAVSGRHTPARHGGRASLGFADGHAHWAPEESFRRSTAEDRQSHLEWQQPRDVYWYPYSGAPR